MENKILLFLKKIFILSGPKKAILVFISVSVFIPFYESKRVVLWESQRDNKSDNIFRQGVLAYSLEAEILKKSLGWDAFFDKEHAFWLKTKKSPILFSQMTLPDTLGLSIESDSAMSAAKQENEIGATDKNNTGGEAGEESSGEEEVEPIARPKREPPFSILIVGDSFMAVAGGLGDPLERTLLTYKDVTVKRLGRVSSGLVVSDYFNWELTVKELISQNNPNIAIVMFGSNDNQSIKNSEGKYIAFGNESWKKEYGKRIDNLLNIFKDNGVTVFWLGMPVMRDQTYSGQMEIINNVCKEQIKNRDDAYFRVSEFGKFRFKIAREGAKQPSAYFISTWELLSDENGKYTAYLPDKDGKYKLARVSDGVHLQFFAGRIIVEEVIKRMEERAALELKEEK